ncbi:S8 family serine peptidase [Deinococcus taeanensis]|uniref:S8 family serine peptidase n=1 Tax=Deinococcus taeanensis TaxID=2737050 RepID=UPI001CDB4FA4|nr:S8 family serine peptidase [Deinococcus taeanensis]UBV43313.1 S8 family serine peptidase [Deinococcus taeanensis]
MRFLLPAVTLTLLVSACRTSTPPAPTPTPTAVCPQATPIPLNTQGVIHPSTLTSTPRWTAPHIPGRVLIASSNFQTQALPAGTQTRTITPTLTLALTPAGTTDQTFAEQLMARGFTVQPDYLYGPLANPNDPGVPGNGGLLIPGTTTPATQTYLTRIHAPEAWTFLQGCGKTPTAALTAVLDTKIDTTHPDLAGRINSAASFLSPDAGGSDTSSGHGTASAGLIGATTNNRTGLAGVTWTGPLLAVEVLGANGGSTTSLTQGLNYAVQQGAKVINMSLGSPGPSSDTILYRALTTAAQSAVLVAAAGNTASEGIYFPASHPDVIAVGAVGPDDNQLACYSARPNATLTRQLDLVAPGGAGNCPGATNASQMLILAPGGSYTLGAGTSFAAPLVSGAAALMRAANPQLSAPATRNLLIASATTTSNSLKILNINAAIRAATK